MLCEGNSEARVTDEVLKNTPDYGNHRGNHRPLQ